MAAFSSPKVSSFPRVVPIKNLVCSDRRELALCLVSDMHLKASKMPRSTLSNLPLFMSSSLIAHVIHVPIQHTCTHTKDVTSPFQSLYRSLCKLTSEVACFLTTCSFIIIATLLIVDSSGLTQGQQSTLHHHVVEQTSFDQEVAV